ncbi:peptidase S54 [Haematobacter missouriensis]|uniref:Rhomboid family intramembrane serine protease n=2 Tax=Haematobacter missouriensis TaxID=366616 RepID=A0ABX3ZWZ7_9RHOB|nr:rhomboid family intramembrane serine protease [Haematobacter missouriensis]KFI27076.1 peptidase S54 [Haematobacter missouriensis]OWJ78716.1 rhomboid family intramembrane serine protease [Haematobacter missouriensis]
MRAMPVVLVLFLACLLPEIVLSGADYGLWGDPGWRLWAWQHGGFWTGLLGNWRPNYAAQPWLMFLTYGFLHGGLVHFGVNMLTLFSLAPPLVDRMGQGRFLLLYMASMIGGGLGFALLSQSPQPMVGASGALFGLAGAVMALSWQYLRARGESLRPVIRSLLWLAVLNAVLWWAMSGMLAWETHLGGFVVGWVMGLWLVRGGR